jgi:hypothetical protein
LFINLHSYKYHNANSETFARKEQGSNYSKKQLYSTDARRGPAFNNKAMFFTATTAAKNNLVVTLQFPLLLPFPLV